MTDSNASNTILHINIKMQFLFTDNVDSMCSDSLIPWLLATVDGVWVVVTSEHLGMSQYSYLSESASVAQAGSLVFEDEDPKMTKFRQKLFASTTVSSGSCPSGQFSNIDKIAHHARHGSPFLDTLWLPVYEVPVVSSKQFGPGTERWNNLNAPMKQIQ